MTFMEAIPQEMVVSPEAEQIRHALESIFHSQNGLLGWSKRVF